MPKRSFGKNLRIVRSHYNISITEMSDQMGVVKSNISRYERDLNKPSIDFVKLLLKHYRVNLNWLFGEKQEMILEPKTEKDEAIISKRGKKEKLSGIIEYTSFQVPVYAGGEIADISTGKSISISGAISAGEPLEMREEGYDFVPFPFYKTQKDLSDYLVFRVNGLSMEPDIHHEDIVFIYKNSNWAELNDRIVAVRLQGDMTLKKLSMNDQKKEIVFKALNKDYEDIFVSYSEMDSTYLVGELKAIRRIYR